MPETKHTSSTSATALRFPPNNHSTHCHHNSSSHVCVVDQVDRAEEDMKHAVSASCKRIKDACMRERSEKERQLQKECDEGKKRESRLRKDLSERQQRVQELEDALSAVKGTIHLLEGMLQGRPGPSGSYSRQLQDELPAHRVAAIAALASKRKRDDFDGESLGPSSKYYKTSTK